MKTVYLLEEIKHDQFVEALEKLVKEEVSTLLSIPGVYEAVSEYFNNDVLKEKQEEAYEEVSKWLCEVKNVVVFGDGGYDDKQAFGVDDLDLTSDPSDVCEYIMTELNLDHERVKVMELWSPDDTVLFRFGKNKDEWKEMETKHHSDIQANH